MNAIPEAIPRQSNATETDENGFQTFSEENTRLL